MSGPSFSDEALDLLRKLLRQTVVERLVAGQPPSIVIYVDPVQAESLRRIVDRGNFEEAARLRKAKK